MSMHFKSISTALLLALGLSACSTMDNMVYQIDVPQGNYLEASKVSQLSVGMNAQQVQYLLGTPLIVDPFSTNSWYYVYIEQRSYRPTEQYSLIVNFDASGRVASFNLSDPLPTESKPAINNSILEAEQPIKKRWWPF